MVYCGDNNDKSNNKKRVICPLEQVNALEFKQFFFLYCLGLEG